MNREFILSSIKQHGLLLGYITCEFQNDREIVLAAVTQDGMSLGYASFELQNDKEIVLVAVKQTGWSLYFASPQLKKDKDIVLAAVKQDGRALYFASIKLKNDREIVLAAIRQNEHAIEHASFELKYEWRKYGKFLNIIYKKINNVNENICLIGHCEIKKEDSYYMCSNEKIQQKHYYLKDNFDNWKKQSKSDKCIFCFEKMINMIFINK